MKRRLRVPPAPVVDGPAVPAPPAVISWGITVRAEGLRARCVLLEIADGRVVGEVLGEPVDRTSAIGYAENAVSALAMGAKPYLPNAVYREVEP